MVVHKSKEQKSGRNGDQKSVQHGKKRTPPAAPDEPSGKKTLGRSGFDPTQAK